MVPGCYISLEYPVYFLSSLIFILRILTALRGCIPDVHCLESGCIGLHIPSDLAISLGPGDVYGYNTMPNHTKYKSLLHQIEITSAS